MNGNGIDPSPFYVHQSREEVARMEVVFTTPI